MTTVLLSRRSLLAAGGSGVGDEDLRLVRVVDGQTRIPGQDGVFAGFSAPVIHDERIAFYAHGLSLQQGIYLYEHRDAPHRRRVVAHLLGAPR